MDSNNSIWVGDIEFSDFKYVNEYKRNMVKLHYILQKGQCCYCEEVCVDPFTEKFTKKTQRKNLDPTLEHLETVADTRLRWKKEKRFDFIKQYGDLSFQNTRMACAKCNTSRPHGMSWLEWKTIKMGEDYEF